MHPPRFPSPPPPKTGRFLVLVLVRGWVNPRTTVQLEGLDKLKKFHNLIGYRTHSLHFQGWTNALFWRQDVIKEQYKKGNLKRNKSIFKHSLNNAHTKYVGYLKCFYDWRKKTLNF
jgi:hypothetical protein